VEVEPDLFRSSYSVTIKVAISVDTESINNALIAAELINSVEDLKEGETVAVYDEKRNSRGVFDWTGDTWVYLEAVLPTFRDMFRFAPGDVAAFRSVSDVRTYQATEHVTPLLDLEVYYDNGVFIRSDVDQTVAWNDPLYHLEDIVYYQKYGATDFYRVTRSFTPPAEREIWNNSIAPNSPRLEEIYGNMLKFVNMGECSDAILSRLRDRASTVKLGTCQLNLVSKSLGSTTSTYVFESAPYAEISAPLSIFPGSSFRLGPVDYGNGTLAL